MRLLVIVLASGCATPPAPVAPSANAERAVATVPDIAGNWVPDIAGNWVSTENLDWHMTIAPAGTIDVWIDRDHGRCEQRGTIRAGRAAGEFRLLYTLGQCNPQAVNVPIDATVHSFTGSHLTIVVGNEARRYERASTVSSDDSDRPAGL